MYIEERIDLTELSIVEHGKQIDMIATGLAALTTLVYTGFAEMRENFIRFEDRFVKLEDRVDRVEIRMDRLEIRMDKLEARMEKFEARLDQLETKMDRRFDELTMLIISLKN
jgi:predicted nuclease with TOPRIM domain